MTAVDTLKNRFGVAAVLKVFGVAASTYYGWLAQERDPSPRRRRDADLLAPVSSGGHDGMFRETQGAGIRARPAQ